MRHAACLLIVVAVTTPLPAQMLESNIRYADSGHERHVLDIYVPSGAKEAPVVFWIHGGGWQTGDKTQIQAKPQYFVDKGYIFVSTNYRLLPEVDMAALTGDVAKALGWVHKHIAERGGDPDRLLVMGHSAGAQLAALLCTDQRYLKEEGVPLTSIKGCVPVDGDTYDIPAMIETEETRQRVHGLPQKEWGHREKFGNDDAKFRDFSAVAHVASGKNIAPFLLMYVGGSRDTSAQAQCLSNVLTGAGIRVKRFAGKESTHNKLNGDIGLPDAPETKAVDDFLAAILAE